MDQELGTRLFLPADADMVANLDKKLPFGKAVSDAFPKCSEDITEAHNCYALGRYTACVFHIGRAMELAVKRLAARMHAAPSKDLWQKYIDAMNDVIKTMPFSNSKEKAKRALFSHATNYLFNFKEAWRNETMHPKKTYTKEQAREVLDGSRSFLQHLSTKIFKKR